MIEACKKNCSRCLEHDEPITFVLSQWQSQKEPSVRYLAYRWIVAFFFFTTWVISIVDVTDAYPGCKTKWLIYVTNWGYTTCTFQSLISAIILSVSVLAPNLQNSALKLYKLYWVLYVIATDIAFVVTPLFWAVVYDPEITLLDPMDIFVHGLNFVVMILDLFVVAHPIRILHCCYTIIFVICYGVFSLIYYAAGGISKDGTVYMYKVLDWEKPGTSSLFCLLVVLYVIIVHTVCWVLYKFRVWIHSKCVSDSEVDSNELRTE